MWISAQEALTDGHRSPVCHQVRKNLREIKKMSTYIPKLVEYKKAIYLGPNK